MSKPVSLERSLFRNLTLGPVVLGIILLATSVFTYRAVLNTIASELTGRAIAQTNSAFAEYLHPVQEVVELSKSFGQAGKFESMVPEELDLVFGPLVETVTQVSSVHLAKRNGDAYMLMQRDGERYYNRLADGDEPGWIDVREWRGDSVPGRRVPRERIASDYAVETRPWFRQALAALDEDRPERGREPLVWSDPYTFFTTKEPGITASVAYRTPGGGTEILGFDILLNDIQAFVERTRVRDDGIVFVMLRAGENEELVVLAIPSDAFAQAETGRTNEFPRPVGDLAGAPGELAALLFSTGVPDTDAPVRFTAEGGKWWGAAALSPLSTDNEVWIAAIIPEDALLRGIPHFSLITLVAVLLTVGLMLLRARRLTRHYGDPIGELVAQTERMARLNFSREVNIESPIYEVQTLATSQDAMRRSLSALTAMNDRAQIARELMNAPGMLHEAAAGRWQIAVSYDPTGPVEGIYPMLWPVRRQGSEAWTLCAADACTGVFMVMVSTQLSGLRAARHAAALSAASRAALAAGAGPQSLYAAVTAELRHGADIKAPAALVCAVFDSETEAVEIVSSGAMSLLHWHRGEVGGSAQWHRAAPPMDAPAVRTHRLAPDEILLVVPDNVFEILDASRQRLTEKDLESWLAGFPDRTAAGIAGELGAAIRGFADPAVCEADLALIALARNPEETGEPIP